MVYISSNIGDMMKPKDNDIILAALDDTKNSSISLVATATNKSIASVNSTLDGIRELIGEDLTDRYLEAIDKQTNRLDTIINSMMPLIQKGNYKAADSAIKAIQVYNELLGLNAPKKSNITTTSKNITLNFRGTKIEQDTQDTNSAEN